MKGIQLLINLMAIIVFIVYLTNLMFNVDVLQQICRLGGEIMKNTLTKISTMIYTDEKICADRCMVFARNVPVKQLCFCDKICG